MVGLPTRSAPKGAVGEIVTPTGAALVKALAQFNSYPSSQNFVPELIGIGAGTKEFPNHPNILRVTIGSLLNKAESYDHITSINEVKEGLLIHEKLIMIETNIDDSSPQVYFYYKIDFVLNIMATRFFNIIYSLDYK